MKRAAQVLGWLSDREFQPASETPWRCAGSKPESGDVGGVKNTRVCP
jgi:hypothetical protein